MNWTGGRLHLHSNKQATNTNSRAQKQHFAKARQRQRMQSRGPDVVPRPSSLSPVKLDLFGGIEISQKPKRKRSLSSNEIGHEERIQPDSLRALTRNAVPVPSPGLQTQHDGSELIGDARSKLEGVRAKLLAQKDWVGVAAAKPLRRRFPSTAERENIGKRRRISSFERVQQSTRGGAREYISHELFSERLRRQNAVSEFYDSDDISVRIGDDIHSTQYGGGSKRSSLEPEDNGEARAELSVDENPRSMLINLSEAVQDTILATHSPLSTQALSDHEARMSMLSNDSPSSGGHMSFVNDIAFSSDVDIDQEDVFAPLSFMRPRNRFGGIQYAPSHGQSMQYQYESMSDGFSTAYTLIGEDRESSSPGPFVQINAAISAQRRITEPGNVIVEPARLGIMNSAPSSDDWRFSRAEEYMEMGTLDSHDSSAHTSSRVSFYVHQANVLRESTPPVNAGAKNQNLSTRASLFTGFQPLQLEYGLGSQVSGPQAQATHENNPMLSDLDGRAETVADDKEIGNVKRQGQHGPVTEYDYGSFFDDGDFELEEDTPMQFA